jgi:hypothetical protein
MTRSTAAAVATVALLAGAAIGWQLGARDTRTLRVTGPTRTVTARVTTSAPSSAASPGVATPPYRPPASRSESRADPGPLIALRGSRKFAGHGTKRLGTLELRRQSELRWTNTQGLFLILFNGNGEAVHSTAHAGKLIVPGGTFHGVEGRGARWTIELTPLPPDRGR